MAEVSVEDVRARLAKHPPHWAHDELLQWPGRWFDEHKVFAVSHYWADSGPLNMALVVGTSSHEYWGVRWIDLLYRERMKSNLELLASHPRYYLDTRHKHPPMRFISLDGHHWFVNGDGTQRTCLARFHLELEGVVPILHGVRLDDWRIARGLAHLYEEMSGVIEGRRLPYRLDARRRTVSRQDGAGWHLERYQPVIELRHRNRVWRAETMTSALRMLEYLKSSRLKRALTAVEWECEGDVEPVKVG